MARKRTLIEERILVNNNQKGPQSSIATTLPPASSLSSWQRVLMRRCVRFLSPAILALTLVYVQRWNVSINMISPHHQQTSGTPTGAAGDVSRSASTTTDLPQSITEERVNEEGQNRTGKLMPSIDKTGSVRYGDDDRQHAYQFAMDRALARSKNNRQPLAENLKSLWQQKSDEYAQQQEPQPILLHLIRIPKAGSSALSVTARALAGCKPDGYPCCRNPKTNKACPLENLDCPAIRGCTGHRPNYRNYTTILTTTTENVTGQQIPFVTTVPMITALRNPVSRAVSAFFYEPPHRPTGTCFSFECFEKDFIKKSRYQNPSTKMLAGHYAYAETPTRTYPINVAKRRLCDMAWFGIAEWNLASSLLLYESHPFTLLQPNPVAFGLPAHSSFAAANATTSSTKNISIKSTAEVGLRKNTNNQYNEFKNGAFVQRNGTDLIHRLHKHDVEVYKFGVQLFCARVQEAPGLLTAVQEAQLSHHFKGCNDLWNANNKSNKMGTGQLCGPLFRESIKAKA